MSRLGFLTPDAGTAVVGTDTVGSDTVGTDEVGSVAVLARSPMEARAQAAGARFLRRHGWSVPAGYGEPGAEAHLLEQTVGFADRSPMTKLELHAPAAQLARLLSAAGDGATLRPGDAARAAGTWWCQMTPTRALALTRSGSGAALRESVAAAVAQAGEPATVIDLTCGLAALCVQGPRAAELLARFCELDVSSRGTPVGGFRPGAIARAPGYLLRESHDRFLIMIGWTLGEYLWEVVADAAAALGGGPVGLAALGELDRA